MAFTVLISGANRGIGKGLLQRYLIQPHHVVIAANRDPSHPTSQSLNDLPKGEGSRLIIVKVDASSETDAAGAAEELQNSYGIDHLDLVIANAGMSTVWPTVVALAIADLQAHMAANAYGVVALYQATRPLLQKSTKEPKFIPIGSKAGCMKDQPPVPNSAYGPTKAVVNWLTVRIHAEDDWLTTVAVHPGLVDTDLGSSGIRWLIHESGYEFIKGFDLEKSMISVGQSCDGIVKVISESVRDKHGGKLVSYTGEIIDW
ncbi:uncharacterized protein PV07_10055 [Cladophialophora immunda]|uniref:Uncharacterized protein n=1 Tax=Cladophialophora immunda TaxID=569365 RepID=A0A0D2CL81_9EURO|nr:uncharacterized protein PV07_10055 [Cladophialophora immunda]KIW24334.1 hypothetical protein PV07_10055 [Cladophialophora immunda]OQU97891.1 hypothetical protein CLAIMM_03761 [Cladophialophora immunda]